MTDSYSSWNDSENLGKTEIAILAAPIRRRYGHDYATHHAAAPLARKNPHRVVQHSCGRAKQASAESAVPLFLEGFSW